MFFHAPFRSAWRNPERMDEQRQTLISSVIILDECVIANALIETNQISVVRSRAAGGCTSGTAGGCSTGRSRVFHDGNGRRGVPPRVGASARVALGTPVRVCCRTPDVNRIQLPSFVEELLQFGFGFSGASQMRGFRCLFSSGSGVSCQRVPLADTYRARNGGER